MAQRRLAAAGAPGTVPSRPRPARLQREKGLFLKENGGFQQENGIFQQENGGFLKENGVFQQENGVFLAFSPSDLGHGGNWAVPKYVKKVFTADLTVRDDVSFHRS